MQVKLLKVLEILKQFLDLTKIYAQLFNVFKFRNLFHLQSLDKNLLSLKTRAHCKSGNVSIKCTAEIRELVVIQTLKSFFYLVLKLVHLQISKGNVGVMGSRTLQICCRCFFEIESGLSNVEKTKK